MALELDEAVDMSNWSGALTVQAGPHLPMALSPTGVQRQVPVFGLLPIPSHRPLSAGRPHNVAPLTVGLDTAVSGSQAQCMVDHGKKLAIIGTQNPTITRAQLSACQGVGLRLHAYVYLYFAGDPVAQMQAAFAAFQGFPVEKLWLDCEDPWAENITESATVAFIDAAAAAATGVIFTGIYTAAYWWKRQTGNSTHFADSGFGLYHASADGEGDLQPVNYGGWTDIEGEQYAFDQDVCGVNVDLNVFRAPVAPTPPPDPTPAAWVEHVSSEVIIRPDGLAEVHTVLRKAA